jgi:hypothetical protein
MWPSAWVWRTAKPRFDRSVGGTLIQEARQIIVMFDVKTMNRYGYAATENQGQQKSDGPTVVADSQHAHFAESRQPDTLPVWRVSTSIPG